MFLLDWLKRVGALFRSDRARADLRRVEELVIHAGPIIDRVARFITVLTPTAIDDEVYKLLRQKFPTLFDGTATVDEVNVMALGAATELFRKKFPKDSTSVLRAAAQLGYIEYAAEKEKR